MEIASLALTTAEIQTIQVLLKGPFTGKQSLPGSILGVTSDSRQVQPGMIFVAVEGSSQNGNQFIADAINRGAVLVVQQGPLQMEGAGLTIVPILQVEDSRLALAHLAALFAHQPSQNLLTLGVTGTSGKTTVTYILESILKSAGHQVGVIGTVNCRMKGQVLESTHTTPGPVELQLLLQRMVDAGCTAVVMEVSSHALDQKRTSFVAFDGMVFMNLSPEHQDYHPDMESYYLAKSSLFTDLADFSISMGKSPVAVIHAKDQYGQRLFDELKQRETSLRVASCIDPQLSHSVNGASGRIGEVQVDSTFVGDFSASNLSAAVTLAQALGVPVSAIETGIQELKGVPGRLERVVNAKGIHVWVDYAHKPDALEKVIASLKSYRAEGRLITVFGCGGDRDRMKRPLMGRIAVQGSDFVVITSDNPRTEDPEAIIQEILVGTAGSQNFEVQVDRRKAIGRALELARPGDLVLIAGKGHEDYQILGKTKIHFDDREVAKQFLTLSLKNQ